MVQYKMIKKKEEKSRKAIIENVWRLQSKGTYKKRESILIREITN